MTKSEQKSATPDKKAEPQDRSPARSKSSGSQDTKGKSDDIPGADGPLSAGANEDTYD